MQRLVFLTLLATAAYAAPGLIQANPWGAVQANPWGSVQANPWGQVQSNPWGAVQSNPWGGVQANPWGSNPWGGQQIIQSAPVIKTIAQPIAVKAVHSAPAVSYASVQLASPQVVKVAQPAYAVSQPIIKTIAQPAYSIQPQIAYAQPAVKTISYGAPALSLGHGGWPGQSVW